MAALFLVVLGTSTLFRNLSHLLVSVFDLATLALLRGFANDVKKIACVPSLNCAARL